MKCIRCGVEMEKIQEREICESCHNELIQEEEEYHDRMNDMYIIDKNGFCNGFTKY